MKGRKFRQPFALRRRRPIYPIKTIIIIVDGSIFEAIEAPCPLPSLQTTFLPFLPPLPPPPPTLAFPLRKHRLIHTLACCSNRSRWINGSFNSVYALQTSLLITNNSNRSVKPFMVLCHLDNGLIISGWSSKNVGFMHSGSIKSPTNLSIKRAVVRGGEHSTLCWTQSLSKKFLASERKWGKYFFWKFTNQTENVVRGRRIFQFICRIHQSE